MWAALKRYANCSIVGLENILIEGQTSHEEAIEKIDELWGKKCKCHDREYDYAVALGTSPQNAWAAMKICFERVMPSFIEFDDRLNKNFPAYDIVACDLVSSRFISNLYRARAANFRNIRDTPSMRIIAENGLDGLICVNCGQFVPYAESKIAAYVCYNCR